MANTCNIDGRIAPEAEATVPVLDRGFLFGDSIYEVVRTIGGVPFAWREHWQRLARSAAGVRLELDLDEATVARRVRDTIEASGMTECYVRIIVTRGTGDAPNIDIAYANQPPRWVVMVRPYQSISGKPVRLCLIDRQRMDRRALDPATKSGNYLNNVLGLAEAKADRDATDCVMLNTDGLVTEASTSNLFVLIDGVWCTPPLSAGVLAGITRELLLGFLARAGERVQERDLTAADLDAAEQMFLSSTLRDIAPVSHYHRARTDDPDSDVRQFAIDDASAPFGRLLEQFRAFLAERFAADDTPYWRALIDG